MFLDIVIELLKGIGRLFINPLFYVAGIFSVFIGYRRVINERKSFNRRVYWGGSEVGLLLKEGLIIAVVLSILAIAVGIVLPMQYIVLVTMISMICILTFYYHLASVAYPFGLAFLILWLTYVKDGEWSIFNWTFSQETMHIDLLVSIPLLIGVLLIVEGFLVKKYASKFASPRLENTSRGLKAVTYLSKRIWILPVFFLLPSGVFEEFAPYWPQFTIGAESYGLIVLPVVFGFQQRARKMLPVHFYPQVGSTIMLLGVLVVIEAIVAIFVPVVGIASVGVAIIGRICISIIYSISERKGAYAVTPNHDGIVIAGVLQDSPAEAMGLKIGEVIRKVNGIPVKTKEELYEALQINAAHCRLEVLDVDGEIRLRQHIIYRHDHFRIGLIMVQ